MQLSILVLLAVAYAAAASPRRILDRQTQTCVHGKQVRQPCDLYDNPGNVDNLCCPGLQCIREIVSYDMRTGYAVYGMVRPSESALFSLTGVLALRRSLRLKG